MNLYHTLKQTSNYIGKIARPLILVLASALPSCTTVEIDLVKSYENLQGIEKKMREQYNADKIKINNDYTSALKNIGEERKNKLKSLDENFDKNMEKYKIEKQGLEKAIEQLHSAMQNKGSKK